MFSNVPPLNNFVAGENEFFAATSYTVSGQNTSSYYDGQTWHVKPLPQGFQDNGYSIMITGGDFLSLYVNSANS